MINILIRTSNRPRFFSECIESIKKQSFKDYNIIVSCDSDDWYCREYNPVRVKRKENTDHRIDGARHFPSNDYLNTMLQTVKSGWVMFLDDDDLLCEGALDVINNSIQDENNVIFWKVDIKGRIVPSEFNFGNRPVKKDMAGIGFCFHSKYIPLIHIAPYKQMDYRLADQLYSWCYPIWIDKVLTKTSNEGQGRRKDKTN